MERLRIEWKTGYMEFSVDDFFPFTWNKAKKIFELINENCSAEVKAELKDYLTNKAMEFKAEMKEYANKAVCFPAKSRECKLWTSKFKKAEKLYKRTLKNLKLLEMGDMQ